jgi:lactoylglutathione lyase
LNDLKFAQHRLMPAVRGFRTSAVKMSLHEGVTDVARLIHSMIRVGDEARSVIFYRAAFGLDIAERLAFDDFTLVYLANDEQSFELELTINHGTAGYEMGNGYGHLAVSVDDLGAAHARISATGAPCTAPRSLQLGDRTLGRFFFVTDPDGYKIEVLQRGGRFK